MTRRGRKEFVAFAQPTVLRPGQERRVLRMRGGERTEDGIARARALTWWPRVVSERPTSSSRHWVWIIDPEAT